MKTITELRDGFAAWAVGEAFQNAFEIMQLLSDETPITEAGLRELGFIKDGCGVFRAEGRMPRVEYLRNDEWQLSGWEIEAKVKTLGRLRMLLLGVGE